MREYPSDLTFDELAEASIAHTGFDPRPRDDTSRWCAAIAAVHVLWRNGPVEDLHSRKIPDEDMFRVNVATTRLAVAALQEFSQPPDWLALAEAMCDQNAHLGGMSRIRRHGRSQAGYLTGLSEAYGWEWTHVFLTFSGSLHTWFGVPWWPQHVDLLDVSDEVRAALLLRPESLGDDDLAGVIWAKYDVDHTRMRKDWREAGSPRWAPPRVRA